MARLMGKVAWRRAQQRICYGNGKVIQRHPVNLLRTLNAGFIRRKPVLCRIDYLPTLQDCSPVQTRQ